MQAVSLHLCWAKTLVRKNELILAFTVFVHMAAAAVEPHNTLATALINCVTCCCVCADTWPGERWVDIRSTTVRDIMRKVSQPAVIEGGNEAVGREGCTAASSVPPRTIHVCAPPRLTPLTHHKYTLHPSTRLSLVHKHVHTHPPLSLLLPPYSLPHATPHSALLCASKRAFLQSTPTTPTATQSAQAFP